MAPACGSRRTRRIGIATAIKLNVIDVPYITRDANARLNLYQDGRVADVDYLPGEALDQVLQQRWPLHRYNEGSVWMLQVNHRPGYVTANDHLRRALQLANDPAELVYKVLKTPSYTVAESLFPAYIKGERGLFREEYPPPRVQIDLDAARASTRACEARARRRGAPAARAAQRRHTRRRDAFGVLAGVLAPRARPDDPHRPTKLQAAAREDEAGEFDIVLYGWSPDYDDPLTFGDLFASWNINNRGRYNNPELDAQVRIAQQSLDRSVRIEGVRRDSAHHHRGRRDDPRDYERGVMYVRGSRG